MTIGIIWPTENGMHSQPFALFVLRPWLFNSIYVQSKCKWTVLAWVLFAISIWPYVLQGNKAGGCFLMPVIKSLLGLLGTWTLTFRARKPSKLLRVSNSYSGADPHRLPPKTDRNRSDFFIINVYTFSNKKYFLSWNRSWRNLLLVPQDLIEACAFGACLGNRSVSILDPCLLFIPSAVNFFFPR